VRFNNREDIIQLTPLWKGERFADGRPRVSDDTLRGMRKVTTEEAWSVLWSKGYQYQFEGNWLNLHPDETLVAAIPNMTGREIGSKVIAVCDRRAVDDRTTFLWRVTSDSCGRVQAVTRPADRREHAVHGL